MHGAQRARLFDVAGLKLGASYPCTWKTRRIEDMVGKFFALVFVLLWKTIKGIVVGCFKLIMWIFANITLLFGLVIAGAMAWGFLVLFS